MLGFRPIGSAPIASRPQQGDGVEIHAPIVGAIVVNAYAPAIRSGARVGVGTTPDIVVNAHAPFITQSATVTVPLSTIVLDAIAPIVRSGAAVKPGAANIVINGAAPSILSGARVVVPSTPDIVLNAHVAEINARRRRVKTNVIQS